MLNIIEAQRTDFLKHSSIAPYQLKNNQVITVIIVVMLDKPSKNFRLGLVCCRMRKMNEFDDLNYELHSILSFRRLILRVTNCRYVPVHFSRYKGSRERLVKEVAKHVSPIKCIFQAVAHYHGYSRSLFPFRGPLSWIAGLRSQNTLEAKREISDQ